MGTPAPVLVLRRGVAVVALALVVVPVWWWRWDASAGAQERPPDARTLYLQDCATCHGADAKGTSRGPSLEPYGPAGVDYVLTTGRMPISSPDQVPERHSPSYAHATIAALVDYVRTLLPGSPEVPVPDVSGADVAHGGVLYRLNCAACHTSTGDGGALLRRNAPALRKSTPAQVAQAVRLGPGMMPSFGRAALTDADLADVAAYVQSLRTPSNEGGWALGSIGPLAEGAAAFVAAGLLVLVLRRIGERHVAERSPR